MPKCKDKEKTQTLISVEDPIADYLQLISANKQQNDDSKMMEEFDEISNAARAVIWQLLFGTTDTNGHNIHTTAAQLIKAAKLLREHRFDVCFFWPRCYNEWILTVRDEFTRRRLNDFWRYAIVKNELGPCWLKDADMIALEEELAG